MSARSSLSILSAAIGAALLAASGPQAAAQSLSEVAVSGQPPTRIAISIAGKSVADVRGEVQVAARTVCRNAVTRHELSFDDVRWCRQKSAAKAMRRYAAIVSASPTAGGPATIVLSSR